MSHANAPLTPAGRLRLVLRCEQRPIAHVAAEVGVFRQPPGQDGRRQGRVPLPAHRRRTASPA